MARTLVAGASVSLIARELKINTNQLLSWRKRFGAGVPAGGNAPGQLVAVTLIDTAPAPAASVAPGVIVLSVGQAQLRLEGQVDVATLTLLLARLLP